MATASVLGSIVLSAAGDGSELRGTVQADDGKPIAGVTAYIYTARPRIGAGVL